MAITRDVSEDRADSTWIRRELRQLPRERRREIAAAIRTGRAVADPRDAALAAAWAEQLCATAQRRWAVLLLTRPHGWRAWTWIVYFVSFAGVFAYEWRTVMWPLLPTPWRWLLVGILIYGAISSPLAIRKVLRTFWNAPEGARQNRRIGER